MPSSPVPFPQTANLPQKSWSLSRPCVIPPFEAVPKKGMRADLAVGNRTGGAGSPVLSTPFPSLRKQFWDSQSCLPACTNKAAPSLSPKLMGGDGHQGQQGSPHCPACDCPPPLHISTELGPNGQLSSLAPSQPGKCSCHLPSHPPPLGPSQSAHPSPDLPSRARSHCC